MNHAIACLTVSGLCLFETISSVDNAIINAEVLSTMGPRSRRWFLLWGMLIAVFGVRGLLPWAIVWAVTPGLGPIGAFTAAFSSDPLVLEAVSLSSPILLLGGGVFLVLLFFHWLFLEEKNYGLPGERFFQRQGAWFYAVASLALAGVVWFALREGPMLAFSAVAGSTVFFITHGFKQNAERGERDLLGADKSDLAKIFYLEIIDAAFSIDGVLGAFAFTLAVPLILIGNGLGAVVVRELTVRNAAAIKKHVYLKNGAMYSILILGGVMVLGAFGAHVPHYVSPLATFGAVGYFFFKSRRAMKG
ncbi:MAG: DUF475 domain-containing protein [Desulfovibrionaceae bacterium]|nr:DUF475 domain-containing protein [Desulfovibrionaceae bacterium]MBF0515147.1 DUF475 domain-containing protein [Desulfovibrionaceae bacterium]